LIQFSKGLLEKYSNTKKEDIAQEEKFKLKLNLLKKEKED